MTVAARTTPELAIGSAHPRLAPPRPAKSRVDAWRTEAAALGIKPLEWQAIGATYLMATSPTGWLYPEVAIAASRQNGKTEVLLPRIRDDLNRGRRVIHTAQNRTLPRQVFLRVARSMDPLDVISIRYANGQEKIEMRNGGSYTIIAPQRGGRGLSADTLIIDEVREFEDWDILDAAGPTLTASDDPQTIFLSNAGSDMSVILNDLKRRGDEGADDLAYLEWSAAPERSIDDRAGWAEGNPSLGHFPRMMTFLEKQYRSVPPATFETEHLCRWVETMQPRIVSEAAWSRCRTTLEEEPVRPAIAFNMDPSGRRASVVMAWVMTDGRIALVELEEATGEPIDAPKLAERVKELIAAHKAKKVGFASWTDKELARHVPRATPVDAKEYALASEQFARYVLEGRIAWDGATHITNDLTWTARKPHESGAWTAVPANPDRSVTAVLAAVRATWMASAPRTVPRIG